MTSYVVVPGISTTRDKLNLYRSYIGILLESEVKNIFVAISYNLLQIFEQHMN